MERIAFWQFPADATAMMCATPCKAYNHWRGSDSVGQSNVRGRPMTMSDNIRQAIKNRYNAEDVKVSDSAGGGQEVFAYGMLPETTILGWFPLGDLDELEARLRANGEL
jgi:hypothetical protein